jgi:hypothetical protein
MVLQPESNTNDTKIKWRINWYSFMVLLMKKYALIDKKDFLKMRLEYVIFSIEKRFHECKCSINIVFGFIW